MKSKGVGGARFPGIVILSIFLGLASGHVFGYSDINDAVTKMERTQCSSSDECAPREYCQNVALRKPVEISSAVFGSAGPMAVDGDPSPSFSKSCVHFNSEERPWIRIDLGDSHLIHGVHLWTRNDGQDWGFRDKNIEVRAGDNKEDFGLNPLCAAVEGAVGVERHLCCEAPLRGRYVTLQRNSGLKEFMHLCEIEVLSCISRCTAVDNSIRRATGEWLNFPGSCVNTLWRDNCLEGNACAEKPSYLITTNHTTVLADDHYSKVTTRMVNVTFNAPSETHVVELMQDKEVRVDGELLPGFPYSIITQSLAVQISRSLAHVYITTNTGLELKWDGGTRLDIAAPSNLARFNCGLCGTAQKNDFNSHGRYTLGDSTTCMSSFAGTPSTMSTNQAELGLSWIDRLDLDDPNCRAECDDPSLLIPRACPALLRQHAETHCHVLRNHNGPMKQCLEALGSEAASIYESCIQDVCSAREDLNGDIVCHHALTMVQVCSSQHNLMLDWRSPTFCPIECSGDTVYQPFGSPCPPSCAHPPGTKCVRADAWQEGCGCPQGMVMNGNKCIYYHECGCQDAETGTYIDVGSTFIKGECNQQCSCDERGGQLRCEAFSCPVGTFCTVEHGQKRCAANICRLEPDPGPCNQSIPRFYFDPEQGMCRKLTYGGCGGNDNNFVRRAQCLWACNPPLSDGMQVCKIPPLIGNCKGSVKRFFFDHKTGQCKSFRYSGCGGNANLFGSMRECRFRCYPWLTPDVCHKPMDPGPCRPLRVAAWFYDALSGTCKPFLRGDCGQERGNSFDTKCDCRMTCAPWHRKTFADVCSLPVDFGVCPEGEVSSSASMWYYDADSAVCTEFQFNGCNGNGNRFKTEKECAEKCTVGTLQW